MVAGEGPRSQSRESPSRGLCLDRELDRGNRNKIQQGERAKGQKDFWGFVWPGAAGEGLTCNALEWQVGEGGGRIIEADGTLSVNNPNVIRSWQRAAHWIGRISSPSVISYEEWDAINTFYLGKAAFY